MNMNKEVLIFAVNKQNVNQDKGYCQAYGIRPENLKCLIGSWEGQMENSYLVDASFLEEVRRLAKHTNQDSVLYLDANRGAYLLTRETNYQVDEAIYIGRFISCSEHYAKQQQGWTLDPEHGQYYCVV
jgi:hypothetical protein